MRAAVDERDATDRHRLEEARDRARRRHGVGNGRRRRAGATEDNAVAVAEAYRGQPQVPLGPVEPNSGRNAATDELGRHRTGGERAGEHHAGPVHPERSQRRPHEQRRRRHARESPATHRSGRKARRPVSHAGPGRGSAPSGETGSPVERAARSRAEKPARSRAPTTDPADVPTITSASRGSQPVASHRPSSTPAW